MVNNSVDRKLDSYGEPEGVSRGPVSKDSKFKETRETADRAAETVGLGEDVETVEAMGHVSEKTAGSRDRAGDGGGARDSSALTIEEIREKLLRTAPDERVMRSQIKNEIEREISDLKGRANKILASSKKTDYSELSSILRKIRELNGVVFGLVKTSMENIKALWLKYVHGIM
jgi:hypothetical protein